jgi:hypothetical protein
MQIFDIDVTEVPDDPDEPADLGDQMTFRLVASDAIGARDHALRIAGLLYGLANRTAPELKTAILSEWPDREPFFAEGTLLQFGGAIGQIVEVG